MARPYSKAARTFSIARTSDRRHRMPLRLLDRPKTLLKSRSTSLWLRLSRLSHFVRSPAFRRKRASSTRRQITHLPANPLTKLRQSIVCSRFRRSRSIEPSQFRFEAEHFPPSGRSNSSAAANGTSLSTGILHCFGNLNSSPTIALIDIFFTVAQRNAYCEIARL